MSDCSRTPELTNASKDKASELEVCTRSFPNSPNMRNAFRTGLPRPLLANSRNPSKYGCPSNSNDQLTEPAKRTFSRATSSDVALSASTVYAAYTAPLRYPFCGLVRAEHAAQPSGSDSPRTIGFSRHSGNDFTIRNPSCMDASCRAIPITTWSPSHFGEPFG